MFKLLSPFGTLGHPLTFQAFQSLRRVRKFLHQLLSQLFHRERLRGNDLLILDESRPGREPTVAHFNPQVTVLATLLLCVSEFFNFEPAPAAPVSIDLSQVVFTDG